MGLVGGPIAFSPIRVGGRETLGLAQLWPDVRARSDLAKSSWLLPLHGGYGVDPLKPPVNLDSKLEQIVEMPSLGLLWLTHLPGFFPLSTRRKAFLWSFGINVSMSSMKALTRAFPKPNPDELRGAGCAD